MTFSNIPGLEKQKKTLINSIQRGKIAHSQIFHGQEGGAALPMALAFFSYLNCTNKLEDNSCGECPSCSKIEKLAHPDLKIIFPTAGGKKERASDFMPQFREVYKANPYITPSDWLSEIKKKSGNIPVSEVRNLIQDLSLSSFEGGYKMVLIWQAEKLNINAANAILKILEEPPSKTLFILVTYTIETLITTIVSRSQAFLIPKLELQDIVSILKNNNTEIPEERAVSAALQSEGNVTFALELSKTQVDHNFDWFVVWMRYLYSNDFINLLSFIDAFDAESLTDQTNKLKFALKTLREIFLYWNGAEELLHSGKTEKDFFEKFGSSIALGNIGAISKEIETAIIHLERNANTKITMLDLSIKILKLLKKI